MKNQNRRTFIGSLTMVGAGSLAMPQYATAGIPAKQKAERFRYCLNTSTIRGQGLGLRKDIEIAADTGYDGIELWVRDIRTYLSEGGSKTDLRKKIDDSGLTFENAIAFSQWIVDDQDVRKKALEELKNDMELLAKLGCRRIAAPPAGATQGKKLDLFDIAQRYHVILELGREFGIKPVLELWGHSINLHSLGQAMFVAIESNHPDACILPDIYHLHRGGSGFSGLKMLSSDAVSMFHINDFPEVIDKNWLKDSDRVFPGDGEAPFSFIIKELKRINPAMVLSLELFNPDYWKMDPYIVASTGLRKMKALTG